MKVKDTYERALLGAGVDDPLADAAARMYAHAVGSLAIFRGSEIVGIITERDVLRAISDKADLATTPVGDYMTSGVVTVTPGCDVGEAAALMISVGARHLPVVDDNGDMLGMLSARDLLYIIDEVALAPSRAPAP